jgi:hypothetical protein
MRDVATKVLPEASARGPERMARFQCEAEVLAFLNHTNMAAIYGVEDHTLVMELVEDDLPKGPSGDPVSLTRCKSATLRKKRNLPSSERETPGNRLFRTLAYLANAGSEVKVCATGMRMARTPICPPNGVPNSMVPRMLAVTGYLSVTSVNA